VFCPSAWHNKKAVLKEALRDEINHDHFLSLVVSILKFAGMNFVFSAMMFCNQALGTS
jgi:hypothetical protein